MVNKFFINNKITSVFNEKKIFYFENFIIFLLFSTQLSLVWTKLSLDINLFSSLLTKLGDRTGRIIISIMPFPDIVNQQTASKV